MSEVPDETPDDDTEPFEMKAHADDRRWKLEGSTKRYVAALLEGPSLEPGERVEVMPVQPVERPRLPLGHPSTSGDHDQLLADCAETEARATAHAQPVERPRDAEAVELVEKVIAEGFGCGIYRKHGECSSCYRVATKAVAALGSVERPCEGHDARQLARWVLNRAGSMPGELVSAANRIVERPCEVTDEWVETLWEDAIGWVAAGPLPKPYVRRIAEKVLEAALTATTEKDGTDA